MNNLAPVISYTGNKYRHLDTILPYLPPNIDKFYDVFGGSGVVGHNVAANSLAQSVIYNEIDRDVHNLLFHALTTSSFVDAVEYISSKYESDKEGYLALRSDYNSGLYDSHRQKYAALYVLHCRSFNNQLRFNKKGEFNLPYGDRNNIKQRLDALRAAREALKDKSIGWCGNDYLTVLSKALDSPTDAFVFIDPPYSNGLAGYQENGQWSEQNDVDLLIRLDRLNQAGVKWMLTNTTYNRGKANQVLIDWLDNREYNVVRLNCNHGNSSYHKSDKKSVEVMVVNY